MRIFPESSCSKYKDFSCVELFELFIGDDILKVAQTEMTKYCFKKNWSDIKVTLQELKVFLGTRIVSGYNNLPQKPLYWSRTPDTLNEAISNAIRRDRFDNIIKCLHFNATGNLDENEKYTKLRPLINHLQKKFMEHFIPKENISHDEAMVEYFGKHSCKQSIRNKPIRFGYKIWCQNTTPGYLISFDPYQGKVHQGDEELETKFGKCAAAVLHLINSYSEDKKTLPFHIFTDNLFTTIPLQNELHRRGYNASGTIRANRIDKTCPMTSVSQFDKKARGFSESLTGTSEKGDVKITRWKDNAVVTVASSHLLHMGNVLQVK